MSKQLTLGISPCPNDTYIFDALVNGLIPTPGYQFQVFHEDVQTLNEWALEGRLQISKISYGVLPLVKQQYHLLSAGGALGLGVGPLLIGANPTLKTRTNITGLRVAIPGINTTAHLLFHLAHPEPVEKLFLPFHEIEKAVLAGEADLGVIIHENRFTYAARGLYLHTDLGAHWEKRTGSPIPLGGIVVDQSLPADLQWQINHWIQQSLLYAHHRAPELSDYIRYHAQEMEEEVMRKHIQLYVNEFSLSLGEEGRKAVQTLFDQYNQIQASQDPIDMPTIIS